MAEEREKILITGMNGFIGSNVAAYLKDKYVLIGLDTDSVCYHGNVDMYVQMVLPNSDLEGTLRVVEPDYCIHCAGAASVGYSVENPGVDFNSGPVVVFHLADSIRKTGINCKIIFPSSAAVYGNPEKLPVAEDSRLGPISPYGYHKASCESILEEFRTIYGVQSTVLRIFSCYGNGLRKQLLWDICNKLKNDKAEFFGTGDETRDFIHIHDVAKLMDMMIEKGDCEVVNVASGVQSSVREVVELIAEIMNYPVKKIQFSGEQMKGYPVHWQADVSKIRELGFSASASMKEGMEEYVRWFEGVIDAK